MASDGRTIQHGPYRQLPGHDQPGSDLHVGISHRLAAVAALTALLALSTATSALAGSSPPGNPPPGSPPPGSGGYSHTVGSNVQVGGSVRPGGTYSGTYVPAQCWLEPRFTNTQSWHQGDPLSYNSYTYDADTYWWSFANNEANVLGAISRIPNARGQINDGFKQYQTSGTPGWWWVPAWLDDSQGLACAKGLVAGGSLNNGYLDFAPPSSGTAVIPGHTIDGKILSELARASLALPTLSLHTSPQAPGTTSYANLPVWVWVTYNGPMRPSDTASVPLPGGGTLWAKVETSRPTVSVSVSDPGKAVVHNNCGATGSRYTAAQAGAVPSCGVTFLAPSAGGPYTLTVTARWTVTWSDSMGASGTFPSPPYPPSRATASVAVTVREVQSINGGG